MSIEMEASVSRRLGSLRINYSDDSQLFRVWRPIDDVSSIAQIQESLWQEFGAGVDLSVPLDKGLTIVGRGEMGFALQRHNLLGSFATKEAVSETKEKLGVEFFEPRHSKIGRLIPKRVHTGWFIAAELDDEQLPLERREALSAINQVVGRDISSWRTFDKCSFNIAQIVSSVGDVVTAEQLVGMVDVDCAVSLGAGAITIGSED